MSAMDDPGFDRVAGETERLAQGFAEHVVRWATRLQSSGVPSRAAPELLRRCAEAVSLATSAGHVCIRLAELARADEDTATVGAALRESGVVGTPERRGSLPLILDADGRLYLHRYFDYEARLARRVAQAASQPPRAVAPAARELLDALFTPAADNEVDWQKIAAAMALRGTLTVISGGPGTGKTTTVVNLLACLLAQDPGIRIALAAPTGKAAARMTEAIGQRAGHLPPDVRARLPQESFTVHRLLGANPGQGRFTHDAGNPIPYDALIVDEASMLDLALATSLLEAVPSGARIVLLGDKDQLAAVEAGAVFAELSADPSLTDPCVRELAALCRAEPDRIVPPAAAQSSPLRDAAVWLARNYRFAADSGIARLARCVNEGRAQDALALLRASEAPAQASAARAQAVPAAKGGSTRKRERDRMSLSLFPELEPADAGSGSAPTSDGSIHWLDPEQGAEAVDAAMAGYATYFETVRRDPQDVDAITRAFGAFRVLCAVREGAGGSVPVNEQVTRRARPVLSSVAADQGQDARSPWYAGRPVMVLRNDYVNKLFNGDIGIALPCGDGLAVHFPDGEGGFRSVPIARMPPHETAFAMTVHKAQGSEFERVLLVLPPRAARVLTRELLYTAITRAKASVAVCAAADVLRTCIGSAVHRESGLRSRI